jgi:glycosyltransferase involved in cell wall biosynthesis
MRVLLLITDLELGGTPTVVRELAIRLHRSGVDIEVACLSKWGPVADQLRNADVPVTALNAKGAHDLLVLRRLTRLIRDRSFTTVFSFLMHANAMAAAASLRVRDVRWIQSIQTTQPWPRWHWAVQVIAQHAASMIVVPSPSVARVANKWAGVAEEKIVVIPNAIDLTDWAGSQSPVPASDPRPYPIAFLGRLDPIKDVPTLVRAVALLVDGPTKPVSKVLRRAGSDAEPSGSSEYPRDRLGDALVHLHIYGEGSDRNRIEQTIAQCNAPVTMHGAIASPQAALSQSGLLVLPSLAEGFGLVLIEAMAAGVPVVATDVPGIRDVVRDGNTGLLVPPADSVSLAAAIRRIVDDRDLRQHLISTAAADTRERFTWDAVLPLYRRLLHA